MLYDNDYIPGTEYWYDSAVVLCRHVCSSLWPYYHGGAQQPKPTSDPKNMYPPIFMRYLWLLLLLLVLSPLMCFGLDSWQFCCLDKPCSPSLAEYTYQPTPRFIATRPLWIVATNCFKLESDQCLCTAVYRRCPQKRLIERQSDSW